MLAEFPKPQKTTAITPPSITKFQPPAFEKHLSLPFCCINYQQREQADTNKGDLAQRDAERWFSLVQSGDQSQDLTERNSWPLAHWQ